ncbi:hypothetical protein HYDPIDRAFT_33601 [Hydnomerulius pinastri MD-312]|uniref:Unplaced genomic scaffold scaffold_67, whole genome shotgun sequence n=1 Tax=Hydnomerulius pinastri MD-312 TaxID=994086 RepID=A0A0C9W7U6_9AGAM|nr:hypothetical protein HYDPIDRAFT_33601 [Hydnomerulius pinastri MD-312]
MYHTHTLPANLKARKWQQATSHNSSKSSLLSDSEVSSAKYTPPQPTMKDTVETPSSITTNNNLKTNRHLPCEPKTAEEARFDLDHNHNSLKSVDCYISILKALQNPPPKTLLLRNVTPSEYAAALAFTSDRKDYPQRAKVMYFPDVQELYIMTASNIHELPIAEVLAAIMEYLQAIGHHRRWAVFAQGQTNTSMLCGTTTVIPDFRLAVRTEDEEDADNVVALWVGECGFSSNYDTMLCKLQNVVEHRPDVDLIFIVFIEAPPWKSPEEGSDIAKILRSQPLLQPLEFLPKRTPTPDFAPIISQNFIWLTVEEVSYHVFLRGPNGIFELSPKDSECAAHGEGAKRLKSFMCTLLEKGNADGSDADRTTTLQRLRTNEATLSCDWGWVAKRLYQASRDTAYKRYEHWHSNNPAKRKNNNQSYEPSESSSHTQQAMKKQKAKASKKPKGRGKGKDQAPIA